YNFAVFAVGQGSALSYFGQDKLRPVLFWPGQGPTLPLTDPYDDVRATGTDRNQRNEHQPAKEDGRWTFWSSARRVWM
ncbi:MAG: hypothetical protein ACPLYD_01260, partial [Anaerolineae bacterium]